MSAGKTILLWIVAIVLGFVLLKFLLGLAIGLVLSLLPIVIVGGILYALYATYGRKALGGGRRTLP